MEKRNIDWFNNEIPLDIREKSKKNICIIAIIPFIILFLALVVINPMGGSRVPGILMTIFVPSFILIIGFLSKRNHPSKVGFSIYAIYLKREDKIIKSIPWKKVIKVTEDGKKVIYSSLWLYGAGLPELLFSEARLNVREYWNKYKKYRKNNPAFRLKEKIHDLKSRKKQVITVSIALIVSIIVNVWMYINILFFELLISLIGGTVLLIVVLIYFINKYLSLKADILEMKKKLKKQ